MEELRERIEKLINDKYGVKAEVVWAAVPPEVKGDYATNIALRIAKQVGRSPRDIAMEIVAEMTPEYDLEVAGAGFINVSWSAKKLWRKLDVEWSDQYGNNKDGEGKMALVEFPSVNLAKPYSVGHLRPGTQGWATKKLFEANGWKVVTDNHLGDAGTPFGIWAVGFLESGKTLEETTVYDLGKIYIDMKARLKTEEDVGEDGLAKRVQDWLMKLEAKDEKAIEFAEAFRRISLEHVHGVMQRMGIATDYEYGESFYVEKGKELVEKYLGEGKFVKNADGSVICELDGFEIPMLVLKSNGAALYATTDLGCMAYRAERWHPDKVVYCAGAEQKFYFEQLFAMGKKLGFEQENIHLWFGMIDQLNEAGKREKMSSRKGVVLMEEMLDDAERRVRSEFGKDLDKEDVRKIAVGAIKYSDFIGDRKTGILYDPEKIFALTGCSGPFCQYAVVRMKRIIEKYDNEKESEAWSEDYDFEAEKEVIKKLIEFPQLIKTTMDSLEVHKIAGYAFDLAQIMNRYYERTEIGGAEKEIRGARLTVIKRAAAVLTRALDVLGVEIPKQM
ncbi:arginine--tRNA ligase [Candidatus Saccharibacteria bacterium]|nr:arginine--tRNA ligase [Candidatus Saccharibacteria bacterium]